MTVQFVPAYLVAIVGLVLGAGAGLLAGRIGRLGTWDARATLPLLLAAAGSHMALLGLVERERQILFALYALSLIGVVVFACIGLGIWRLGAVVMPAGSILAYAFFAAQVHEIDYVGTAVKIVELLAIRAAIRPVLVRRPAAPRQQPRPTT